MTDFVPEGDAILCEPVHEPPDESGFIYEETGRLPQYRILKAGSEKLQPHVVPGDIVICDSVGNKFVQDGRKDYYKFANDLYDIINS